MQSNLSDSLSKVCEILNKHSVEYLIVGGSAVAFHGFYRASRTSSGAVAEKHDLDFWYNPTYDNFYRVLDALGELGVDVAKFKKDKTPDPKRSFFRKEFEGFTLDLVPEMPGLPRFRACYGRKIDSKIGEIAAPVISYEDLILNKEKLGRPKDIEDVQQLDLRKGGRKK